MRVEIRLKPLVRRVAGLLPIAFFLNALLNIYSNVTVSAEYAGDVTVAIIAVLVWATIEHSLRSNLTVLDEVGVKRLILLRIYRIVFYREETGFGWSNVEYFEGGFAGYFSGYRLWGINGQGKRKMILLNNTSTNLDEAVRFIVSKLPREKIDEKLLSKLG